MRRIDMIQATLNDAPERPWFVVEGPEVYGGRPLGWRYNEDDTRKAPIFEFGGKWPCAGVFNLVINGPADLDWAVTRILRLEEALREAKVEHRDIVEGADTRGCRAGEYDPFHGGKYGCSPECGAEAHNALIDAALKEDS